MKNHESLTKTAKENHHNVTIIAPSPDSRIAALAARSGINLFNAQMIKFKRP